MEYPADAQSKDNEIAATAQSRYISMETNRRPFLDRARQCSELTLPYLIPPEGWTGMSELYTPFQGIGSRGTNNLASRLMLTLFPANSPFARMRINGRAEDQAKVADPKLKTEIEAQLADIERKTFLVAIETEKDRAFVTNERRPHRSR